MAKKIRLFTGSTGLNTHEDPARIQYNPKTGVQDLAACKNIDISDNGRVSRRKGFAQQVALSGCHSSFCDGGECLFVYGDALCVLGKDYNYTAIRNVTVGASLRCRQVDDVIYYCNGFERGYVFEGTSYGWNMPDYYGPDTTREFTDPPIGTDLEYYASRMFVVQGKIVPYSELFDISTFDLKNYLPFDREVVMFKAVDDGIYASTDKETFFLSGMDAKSLAISKVADYPAIKGSEVKIVGRLVQLKNGRFTVITEGGRASLMWLSNKGICFGGPEGQFVNFTEGRVDLPNALTGCGLVYNDRYIGIMNP